MGFEVDRRDIRARAALLFLFASLVAFAPFASAATIAAVVTDEAGRPLPDAVVTITPDAGTPLPASASGNNGTALIDQTNETFVPALVVIHTGGTVVFRNSDGIRHHVYSFSAPKRFEMVQPPGQTSVPVLFDKPGAVAIGCNIHDHMTAHIMVTDAPWAQVTDAHGRAVLKDLPAGHFSATVWHPRLRPRTEPPVQPVQLATDQTTLSVTLPVLPPKRPHPRDY